MILGSNEGPHRRCKLTLDEKRTQVYIEKYKWVSFLYSSQLTEGSFTI